LRTCRVAVVGLVPGAYLFGAVRGLRRPCLKCSENHQTSPLYFPTNHIKLDRFGLQTINESFSQESARVDQLKDFKTCGLLKRQITGFEQYSI
jgi:hypothetical protein